MLLLSLTLWLAQPEHESCKPPDKPLDTLVREFITTCIRTKVSASSRRTGPCGSPPFRLPRN
jgi:hypothetical protein